MQKPLGADVRPGIPSDERRRALVTCLWLATAVLLGGFDLPLLGYAAFQFAPFGIVAGLLGVLYVFVLVQRRVIWRSRGWIEALLLVYWTAATAMMFRVLLPTAGLVQVGLVIGAAIAAGVIVSRRDRDEAVLWLGIVAIVLAVLRFALVPLFEARSGLPDWGPLKFGEAANSFRDLFVAYAPQRPAVQALHFAALACYALALRAQWGAERDRTGRGRHRGGSAGAGPDSHS
ncbi:MAG: hypothetical protein ACREMD_05010 [Gemmatimonadota bacterium]